MESSRPTTDPSGAAAGFAKGCAGHSTLFLSVALLVAGNGLQGTLLGVRAGLEGMSGQSIGLFMSSYFLGYIVGSLLISRVVGTVGHIRTFAGLTSIASSVSLAHVLMISPWTWAALRAIHGVCYAGLVLVIESWLNAQTDSSRRGRTLAAYGSIVLLFLALGQLLLNEASPGGFVPFCVVSILLSLALVPVTMTGVSAPEPVPARRMSLGRVFDVSPIGVIGVFVAGLTFSAFSGLGPTYALEKGLGTAGVSLFMSSALVGALLLQWPLGLLSDHFDRRGVILLCAASSVALSGALAYRGDLSPGLLIGLTACFGSASVPVYSVCVANAVDWVEVDNVIPVTSTLLLVFGLGSVLGPVTSGFAMTSVGPGGLFLVIGSVNLLFLLYGLLRLRRPRPPEQSRESFVALPRTTHVALELDERGGKSSEAGSGRRS